MRIAVLIAMKDLRERMRDRSLLMFAILLPLGLAAIFNSILGGAAGGSETFRYAVVNADQGASATHFVDHVLRPVERAKVITLSSAASAEQASRMVDKGDVAAAIVIPRGFTAAVEGGDATSLQVIGNVDAPIAVEVARSLASSYATELRAVRLSVATTIAGSGGSDPAEARSLAARAAELGAPVSLKDVSASRRELDGKTYMAAGMAVFFLFFTVQFGVSSLLQERDSGTLPRLLAAPVSRVSVLAGKLLVSVLVGLISMAVLVVATSVLLGANWGNPVGVALLVVAGVLAATGVMSIVTSLARTFEQAGNWQAVLAVILGMLGGSFFPVAQVGGPIAALSVITPHHWFLRGLADLAGGDGVSVVLAPVTAMVVFAVVTVGISLFRLRRIVGV